MLGLSAVTALASALLMPMAALGTGPAPDPEPGASASTSQTSTSQAATAQSGDSRGPGPAAISPAAPLPAGTDGAQTLLDSALPDVGSNSAGGATAIEPTSPDARESSPTEADQQSASPLSATDEVTTGERRVLSKVHTDAISAYVDDGTLVAATKADVDGQEGKRFNPDDIVFNIEQASERTLPDGVPDWLGRTGDTVYWAPQTWADKNIIWPGFSTQDPNLISAIGQSGQVRYTLSKTVGPGSVEVFLDGNFGGYTRWFSSSDADFASHDIPANTHAHANWVFSKAGRYELTFQMTATVNGSVQRTEATYVFIVGDASALRQDTQTYLSATSAGDGDALTLQALVTAPVPGGDGSSYATTGTVEIFRGPQDSADPATRKGMTSVASLDLKSGGATSDSIEDPGGTSVFVAVFHPKFSNEFGSSTSSVADRGMPDLARDGLSVAAVSGSDIRAGSTVKGTLSDASVADGTDYVVWLRDTTAMTRRLGEVTVKDGHFTVDLPQGLGASRWHKLALTHRGDLVAWSEFSVVGDNGGLPDAPPDADGGGDQNGSGGGGQGGTGGGTDTPGGGGTTGGGTGDTGTGGAGNGGGTTTDASGERVCQPAVTLDHGHMDIWNVTYSNGGIVMQIKEDATGSHVLREPGTTLLRVKESARQSVPSGYPGGGGMAYVLPLSQDSNLIWPGWDTNGTKSGPFTDVSIHITSVDGPGSVYLYSQDTFGATTSLFEGGGFRFPATIREKTPAHTHAQWTFSQAGIYVLKAYAVATNPQTGTSVTSAVQPYVFQVGDVSIGSVFCGLGADATAVKTANADEIAAATKAADENKGQNEADQAQSALSADQAAAEANKKAGAGSAVAGAGSSSGVASLLGGTGSPLAYAAIGAGFVAVAGAIGIGTAALIKRRNAALAALTRH